MGLNLGESYCSERKYFPFSFPYSSPVCTSPCVEVELPAAPGPTLTALGLLPPRRRAGRAPPDRPHGFLFFPGLSRELRRKPALYRDADTTLLRELKSLKGSREGGLPLVQLRLLQCDRT